MDKMISSLIGEDKNLQRLSELVDNLPPFPTSRVESPGFKEYDIDAGTFMGWNLLNNKHVSCAKFFMSAGTRLDEHIHEQKEILIIYKGSQYLKVNGKDHFLKAGDVFVLQPEVPHSGYAVTDCLFIAITIPQSQDWPTDEQ